MSRSFCVRVCVVVTIAACFAQVGMLGVGAQEKKPKPKSYRLPSTSLKEPILWGSSAESPEGFALSFGGEDQTSDDGQSHTRVKRNGEWVSILPELRQADRLGLPRVELGIYRNNAAQYGANVRRAYFEGVPFEEGVNAFSAHRFRTGLSSEIDSLDQLCKVLDPARAEVAREAIRRYLKPLNDRIGELEAELAKPKRANPAWYESWCQAQLAIEQTIAALSAEPPPRALTPLVYEPKSKLFILFGGDHLDYLTNDLWVFDPAKMSWQLRLVSKAPPPRANHTLKATGDGKITLTGGYTYTSSTDYVGGQYRDLDDGEWVYDVAANTWSRPEDGVASDARTYRTGALHPSFYLTGEAPDSAAVTKRLAELPANTWMKMNPPQLPKLNRDWGTAVIDPDHDLILRFSGGHSAHGGTDVLHYHLATNRWELCFPVEFPLGQLYDNTEYPSGFNFNLRPWVTGHTYQNYAYDPLARRMLFTGETKHTYYYDPERGDWGPSAFGEEPRRVLKPKGMNYGSCFYTLTLCPTPLGVVCWTNEGKLFRHEAKENQWRELVTTTPDLKLPGSVVDNSTVIYDSKRDRLVMARKPYGDKNAYDGQLYEVDLKTLGVKVLSPEGKEIGADVIYLCQIRYDSEHDLFLAGCTMPAPEGELRRTAIYDPAANRWSSLAIQGDDPSGSKGRNVSLGMQYDAKRKLFWAVDTNSQVYVLRLARE